MTTLRPERPEDAPAIHALHALCFPTAAEARLVDCLRERGELHLSIVALDEEEAVIGHVAFSPVTLAGATEGVGLAPVSVHPDHRRRGLAADLVQVGLQSCRHAGYGFVVVLGDPAYYGRFGFEPASRRGLSCVFGGGDAFQVIKLLSEALPKSGGVVAYADCFGDLEE